MTHHVLRFAAGTHTGRQRTVNEDSAFASPGLLAVADGMGGHPHGDVASRTAITVLAEAAPHRAAGREGGDPGPALASAVTDIAARLDDLGRHDPDLARMGTTLTALAWDGAGFAVAHIGDSRAYVLRGGVLERITRDHTMVQILVDEGRLTPEQAARHPRASVLVRALQGGARAQPDLYHREARPGDRYLLCSDGVSGVIPDEAIRDALDAPAPEEAVDRLVALANGAGGPDNITCVVADVVPEAADADTQSPELLGAAAHAPTGPLARLGRRLRRA
ncbi:PP2C family serine/threonine-protein phosphatase [Actinomadura sp. NEAU-AAG7]|uniref:PP2C family protein-serine/threonine phosphatase n=1 Tax=Actinomadura sp. NEAU-AAG7 TaxID=2839640 RepID=UPI001BE49458|nr:protein phosphatase 2C domain-containing protein [Actinomadura sp. NEAU-AAG7]MBT2211641.1 serine/threonine-protein phosphatase [Actinomadura sp. NEAU-AAG7]